MKNIKLFFKDSVKAFFLPRRAREARRKKQNFLGNLNFRELRSLLKSLPLHTHVTIPKKDSTISIIAENRFSASEPASVSIKWKD